MTNRPAHNRHGTIEKPGLAAREVAATVLTRVVDDGRSLDGLLDTRHGPSGLKSLSSEDARLVRAIAVAALRHRGFIDDCLNKLMSRRPPQKARHLLHTLQIAAAQILYLDVPDSAAVDLAVAALSNNPRSTRFAGLANAVLRRLSREKAGLMDATDADEAARLNMPGWLWQSTRKSFGKQRAQDIARAHMLEPIIDVTVKSDPESWARELQGTVIFGNSIRVCAAGNVDTWPGYGDGAWWVQDIAAHIPALLFGEIVGKSVADLCAAPGGKTAQLVARGAQVTALEVSEDRLKRLSNNLERLNMKAELVNADLFKWRPEKLFDGILLDAPCSSTGTIRRHPDVQWSKSADQVAELAQLQLQMIKRAAHFLKPGGTLVFSNCSLNRQEGEDVFAKVASMPWGLDADVITANEVFGHDEFITGQGTVRTLPCHLSNIVAPDGAEIDPLRFAGADGFFAGRFKRNDVSLPQPDPQESVTV